MVPNMIYADLRKVCQNKAGHNHMVPYQSQMGREEMIRISLPSVFFFSDLFFPRKIQKPTLTNQVQVAQTIFPAVDFHIDRDLIKLICITY